MLGKLLRNLPQPPRRRYHIVAGTHSWAEGRAAARARLARRYADETLIRAYEERFAAAVGAGFAVSFGANRMGLYALLEALGAGAGDEIVLSAYTCIAVPNALHFLGVKPVYVDIDPVRFNPLPEQIAGAITPRTRAILMQHTFGVPADVARIREIGARHGVPVIEDAAHSLGSRWQGAPSGALSEAAVFSTDRSKVISTLLGGMVTTRDAALAQKLRAIQRRTPFMSDRLVSRILFSFLFELSCYRPSTLWLGHSASALCRNLELLFYYSDEMMDERPSEYPFPCRLSSAQAEIGLSQLDSLEANLAHRRRIAGWLQERTGWYGADVPLGELSWLRFPLLVRDRAAFVARLKKRFDLGGWFEVPFRAVSGMRNTTGYEAGRCPVAEAVSRHIVALPTHPGVPLAALQQEWLKNEEWILGSLVRL